MWESFVSGVEAVNNAVNGFVWGIPMLVLLIGTGVYMTIRTKFFQVSHAKKVTDSTILAVFKKKSVTKTKDKKAISQFQALTTALAATIGTGNIAGVATAIAIGGPGAVFWMWVSAFFGMMTNYSENVLGIYFRRKNKDGEWSGGPMYYLQDGLKEKKGLSAIAKPLAVLFAVFCILASFGIGNMTQVNSISGAMTTNFNIPTLVTGIVLAIIAALVIVGGIKRIGQVTEKLVPFMAIAYVVGALIIFFMNIDQIPYVFGSIFKDAFNFTAIGGGVGGYIVMRAITMGFKRGVFSNEAGLGSSVMVHSASDVKEPVKQGMWGIFEVFFDTIIVCTLTAFVLLSSSSNAMTMDEAFKNITTDTTYFQISDTSDYDGEVNLIDADYNMVFSPESDSNGNTFVQTTGSGQKLSIYGKDYYLPEIKTQATGEGDYIYTNIMSVKANPKTDSDGNAILDENGNPEILSLNFNKVEGVSLVTYAFSLRFGNIAGQFLTIAILLFAFSTVLGWSYYGTKSVEFLFGTKATIIYKVVFVLFIVVGATMSLQLAWDISDTLNGLMAIPNLIGVLALSGTVIAITKNWVKRELKGEKLKPMLSKFPNIEAEQAAKINDED